MTKNDPSNGIESVSRERIAQGVAAWMHYSTGLGPNEDFLVDGQSIRDLRIVYSRREVLTRRIGSDILNGLPYWLYRPVTTALKKMRGGGPKTHVTASLGKSLFMQRYMNLRHDRARNAAPRLTVCLFHDVDTAACYQHWPSTVDLEESLGLKSTWNVLTAGPYKLERNRVLDVYNRGFEIGLHGDTHDMAIGFRNLQTVRERLCRALATIDVPVLGYRAPALGFSEPLLRLLSEIGIRYDSSIKLRAFFHDGTDVCVPYLHPAANLWELPLALSDDSLLRERSLSDDATLEVVRSTAAEIKRHGGLLVFNSHPINLVGREDLYRRILLLLRDELNAEIILARDLVTSLEQNIASV